ncbi:MAG TPA: hypothetical protein VHS97_17900, partial [Isosphaeraceae bacterium]|nr:hypothetical protein [Isosphaeraceae bacterium]
RAQSEAERVRGRAWSSFPEAGQLADRLVQIAMELPPEPPETVYNSFKQSVRGGEGLSLGGTASGASSAGESAAAPPAGRTPVLQAGDELSGLGTVIQGLRAILTRAGQSIAGLKEKAQWDWIDHSALLRKLVREFREGDPERALRRAIPITAPGDRTQSATANQLPWSRAIYSLGELLKRQGRGEATPVLPAEPGLVQLLTREYHRAAKRAIDQGDFRRAAYIYGVLLREDRLAAGALQRGGLHHDAAIIYQRKLNDKAAAAQAFEAAGAIDRAVALYRQMGRHEAAGDLLRRVGEDDLALVEYAAAAALLAGLTPPDHLAAGRLWLEKARCPDQAIGAFQTGWSRRPEGNAALCGLELVRLHSQRGAIEPIRALLDQVDAHFETFGKSFDGFFYNEVVRLAGVPSMAPFTDELRDRALQSLARRLRQGVEGYQSAPSLVAALLGRTKLWPTAVVSDAEFAATSEQKRSRAVAATPIHDPRITRVQIERGTVTAVCQSKVTGELYLGFAGGQVIAYRADRNQAVKVGEGAGVVAGLAVDPTGQTLVTLRQFDREAVLSSFRKHPDGSYRHRPDVHFSVSPQSWLTPVLRLGVERLVGLSDGRDLHIIDAASGILWQRRRISVSAPLAPWSALLLPADSPRAWPHSRLMILTHDRERWIIVDEDGELLHMTFYDWQPGIPESSSLRSAPVSWQIVPPFIELLGLDITGAVYGARFHGEGRKIEVVSMQVARTPEGYLAAARAGADTVVAVSRSRIDWLDRSADHFHVKAKMNVDFPTAVACFPSPGAQETLVVCSDGMIAHVAPPRRARVGQMDG